MREISIFEAIVQPSVERIALIDIQYRDVTEGRPCIISHVVFRNVFTDFDAKLSRHLAATKGIGFPSISCTVRVRDCADDASWHDGATQHFASIPHAFEGIARHALGERDEIELFVGGVEDPSSTDRGDGTTRTVTRSDIRALRASLDFCRAFGAYEFLDVSGDFDLIMVRPLGTELNAVNMDLYRGTMAVPVSYGGMNEYFEGALFDFRHHCNENPILRNYLAAARKAVSTAKENAVMNFRSAAEERILSFDRVLAGRTLTAHRLDAAMSLVARLRVGLGDDLNGISEDARITALDWAEAVNAGARDPHFGGRARPREDFREKTYPLPDERNRV